MQLPTSLSKYEILKQSFNRWLTAHNAHAVIAVSPENVLHTSGAYVISQRTIRDRLAMTIFPLEDEPTFLVGDVVHRTAKADSWINDTRAYAEHHQTPMQALAEILREKGLTTGRIALETRYLPAQSYLELSGELPSISFIDAEQILNDTRLEKSAAEVELMRKIAVATEKAIEHGFHFTRPGDTELQVVDRMRGALHELGADWNPFIILAAGRKNTMEQHHLSEDKPIRKGDIIHAALVGYWGGYYTGFARMAVVGEPTNAQREAYHKLVEVQRFVIEAARPDVRAGDLYATCVDYSRRVGMPFDTNLIGHSLGIGFHECPVLTCNCKRPLAANMTLTIEIASREPDIGRLHIEDLILVQEDGHTLLTNHMDTSEMFVIR